MEKMQQQQQQQQQQLDVASAVAEEAQKRNTDCVYFLASPLTCKKGSECDYRHSEMARLNPKDCRYWYSGSCLNQLCPFRHPPLEGLNAMAEPFPVTKSRAPCYYFFQGYCAKGDKCQYMHAPPLAAGTGNPQSQSATRSTASAEPQQPEKKPVNVTDTSVFKTDTPQGMVIESQNFTQSKESPIDPYPAQENVENAATRHSSSENDYDPVDAPEPAIDGNPSTKSPEAEAQNTNEWLENDMDDDEWLEDSSPGFDVLVDDGHGQNVFQEDIAYISSYDMDGVHDLALSQEGIIPNGEDMFLYDSMHNLGSGEGVHYGHPPYRGFDEVLHGYVPYNHELGHKRKSYDGDSYDGRAMQRKRDLSGDRFSGENQRVDLRHRLAKRMKSNRSLSEEPDRKMHLDARDGDFLHRHQHRGKEQRFHDAIVKKHHTGRTLKARFNEQVLDRELGWEQGRKRNLSNTDFVRDNFRRMPRDKERGRGHLNTSLSQERSSPRKQFGKSNELRDAVDFARPKTLQQIKEEKRRANMREANSLSVGEKSPRSAHRLHEDSKADSGLRKKFINKSSLHDSSNTLSFDGPKPLSVILEEKRKAAKRFTASSCSLDLQESNPTSNISRGDWQAVSIKSKMSNPVGINAEQAGDEFNHLEGGNVKIGESHNTVEPVNEEFIEEEDDDFAKRMGGLFA